MNPVLTFDWGTFQWHVASYRFFFYFAAVATASIALAVATARGIPWRRALACLLATAAAVPVGARLLDVATKTDLYRQEPERLLSADLMGFSMYGGLMLAAAVGVLVCRGLSLGLGRMADSVAPGLGVGIALIRVGCFEAGCCFGREADLPWAVTYPPGSEVHIYQLLKGGRLLFGGGPPLSVHPTQLYEMLAGLAAAALALWIIHRRAPEGVAFLAGVGWYSAFRLINHNLRVPGVSLIVPEWFYPALYVVLLLVSAAACLWLTLGSRALPASRRRGSGGGGRGASLRSAAPST